MADSRIRKEIILHRSSNISEITGNIEDIDCELAGTFYHVFLQDTRFTWAKLYVYYDGLEFLAIFRRNGGVDVTCDDLDELKAMLLEPVVWTGQRENVDKELEDVLKDDDEVDYAEEYLLRATNAVSDGPSMRLSLLSIAHAMIEIRNNVDYMVHKSNDVVSGIDNNITLYSDTDIETVRAGMARAIQAITKNKA